MSELQHDEEIVWRRLLCSVAVLGSDAADMVERACQHWLGLVLHHRGASLYDALAKVYAASAAAAAAAPLHITVRGVDLAVASFACRYPEQAPMLFNLMKLSRNHSTFAALASSIAATGAAASIASTLYSSHPDLLACVIAACSRKTQVQMVSKFLADDSIDVLLKACVIDDATFLEGSRRLYALLLEAVLVHAQEMSSETLRKVLLLGTSCRRDTAVTTLALMFSSGPLHTCIRVANIIVPDWNADQDAVQNLLLPAIGQALSINSTFPVNLLSSLLQADVQKRAPVVLRQDVFIDVLGGSLAVPALRNLVSIPPAGIPHLLRLRRLLPDQAILCDLLLHSITNTTSTALLLRHCVVDCGLHVERDLFERLLNTSIDLSDLQAAFATLLHLHLCGEADTGAVIGSLQVLGQLFSSRIPALRTSCESNANNGLPHILVSLLRSSLALVRLESLKALLQLQQAFPEWPNKQFCSGGRVRTIVSCLSDSHDQIAYLSARFIAGLPASMELFCEIWEAGLVQGLTRHALACVASALFELIRHKPDTLQLAYTVLATPDLNSAQIMLVVLRLIVQKRLSPAPSVPLLLSWLDVVVVSTLSEVGAHSNAAVAVALDLLVACADLSEWRTVLQPMMPWVVGVCLESPNRSVRDAASYLTQRISEAHPEFSMLPEILAWRRRHLKRASNVCEDSPVLAALQAPLFDEH